MNTKENKDMYYVFGNSAFDETSESSTPEQRLASEAEVIANESPENARIIKQAAEKAECAYRQRVQKALEGSAELELIRGPQGKRFVLKHFLDGREYTVYGTVYPGYDADEERAKTLTNAAVFLQADSHPRVYNSYTTLARLKKCLEELKSPYVIKFFD